MNWKNVVIAFLLACVVGGFIFSRHAVKQIDKQLKHADSVVVAATDKYNRQRKESARRDSIDAEQDRTARKQIAAANKARHEAILLRDSLKADTTTSDSLRTYRRIDEQNQVEISSLRSRIYTDSLRILNITKDRDDWKFTADSLERANLDIARDCAKIAHIAKRQVNLGILTVPVEVIEIGLAGGAGYLIGKATSSSHK